MTRRVHIGRRDAGDTGVFVTKPGFEADVTQPAKNMLFSSDLETFDVQATGTIINMSSRSAQALNFTETLPRIPMGLFTWSPNNSNGVVSLYGGSLSLDHSKVYDTTLNLCRSYDLQGIPRAGSAGLMVDLYKDRVVINNHFYSAVDVAYLIFDNYFEPAT